MSDLEAAVAAGVLGAEEGYRSLLQATVEVARAIFGAKASSVFMLDEAADELVFEAVAGEGAERARRAPLSVEHRHRRLGARHPPAARRRRRVVRHAVLARHGGVDRLRAAERDGRAAARRGARPRRARGARPARRDAVHARRGRSARPVREPGRDRARPAPAGAAGACGAGGRGRPGAARTDRVARSSRASRRSARRCCSCSRRSSDSPARGRERRSPGTWPGLQEIRCARGLEKRVSLDVVVLGLVLRLGRRQEAVPLDLVLGLLLVGEAVPLDLVLGLLLVARKPCASTSGSSFARKSLPR